MKILKGWLAPLLVILSGIITMPGRAADNLHFFGSLVHEPCTIAPGDEDLQLDFGEIVDKYIYANGRTRSLPVPLHLVGCDTSIAENVKITFSGVENASLPGRLTLDVGSAASGIAIGMELPQGNAWPLNSERSMTLSDGTTVIPLHAYVQGEPEAIRDKTIARGLFIASATFTLDYE